MSQYAVKIQKLQGGEIEIYRVDYKSKGDAKQDEKWLLVNGYWYDINGNGPNLVYRVFSEVIP